MPAARTAPDIGELLRHPAARRVFKGLADGTPPGRIASDLVGEELRARVERAFGLAPKAARPARKVAPAKVDPVVIDVDYEVIDVTPGVKRRWKKE